MGPQHAAGAQLFSPPDFDLARGAHRFDLSPFQPHRRGLCRNATRPNLGIFRAKHSFGSL